MLLKARHGYSGSERCGRVIVLGCKSMYNMSTLARLLRNILNKNVINAVKGFSRRCETKGDLKSSGILWQLGDEVM